MRIRKAMSVASLGVVSYRNPYEAELHRQKQAETQRKAEERWGVERLRKMKIILAVTLALLFGGCTAAALVSGDTEAGTPVVTVDSPNP